MSLTPGGAPDGRLPSAERDAYDELDAIAEQLFGPGRCYVDLTEDERQRVSWASLRDLLDSLRSANGR